MVLLTFIHLFLYLDAEKKNLEFQVINGPARNSSFLTRLFGFSAFS